MSEPPKFRTFRDLRSLPNDLSENNGTPSPSTTSISSNTSISNNTGIDLLKKSDKTIPLPTIEISPNKDFQKVPNSVTRQMMAQGIFRGKSKQVWDYLWSVSRGAITPARFIKKSRKEIKAGSGLGSMVTVDASIEHLVRVGLLRVVKAVGSYTGNEYEIFTPEEVQINEDSSTSISSITRYTSPIQKVVILDIPESSNTSITQTVENKGVYNDPKTSLKTNTNDDESGIALFVEKFEAVSQKLTGQGIKKTEAEKWGKLADLLILELEMAARRTKSISSLPAFLTEVLRRRFLATVEVDLKSAKTADKNSIQQKLEWVDIGKNFDDVESSFNSETGEYAINPLNAKGRKEALQMLQEIKAEESEEFLQSFRKWYVAKDWTWLMKNLSGDKIKGSTNKNSTSKVRDDSELVEKTKN